LRETIRHGEKLQTKLRETIRHGEQLQTELREGIRHGEQPLQKMERQFAMANSHYKKAPKGLCNAAPLGLSCLLGA